MIKSCNANIIFEKFESGFSARFFRSRFFFFKPGGGIINLLAFFHGCAGGIYTLLLRFFYNEIKADGLVGSPLQTGVSVCNELRARRKETLIYRG